VETRVANNGVSVVIPAYNASATIGECLASLTSQKGLAVPLQVVVVDDKSTDTTTDVVAEYQQRTDGDQVSIELLLQPRIQGPAAAPNRGAKAARADIILFTDADCVPEENWVHEMTKPLQDSRIAAVKGAYKTRQKSVVARFAQAEFEDRYRLLARRETIDVLFTYAAAIRKSVFLDIGGFDPSFPIADNEDTELSWRVTGAGHTIVFNPGAIVYHRHPDSLRSYLRKKFQRAYWRIYVYLRFPEKAVRDSYTPQMLKFQIALVCLLGLCFVISVIIPVTKVLWLVLIGGFLLTTVPFLRSLSGADSTLYVISPLMLFARAGVMAAGVAAAIPLLVKGLVRSVATR